MNTQAFITKAMLVLVATYLAGSPATAAPIVVNVDAQENSGADYTVGASVELQAGCWQIAVHDDPGDDYDAWSPWSSDSDPAAHGRPWHWAVRVTVPGVFDSAGYWAPVDTGYYPTAQAALSANIEGPKLALTLTSPATVYFWFSDTLPWDNRGGVSVAIERAATSEFSFAPSDDTFVVMRAPDTVYGAATEMVVENRYGYASSYWEEDALVRFDLSTLPSGARVSSATLHLYYYQFHDNDPAGRVLTCYSVSGDWNEGTTTWNTQPGHAPAPTSSAVVPPAPGAWMTWDVTADVQAFAADPEANNYGWEIMDEAPWGDFDIPWTRFYSKEFGSFAPYLTIEAARLGDLNCDGLLNVFDIDPFVLALTDQISYQELYPCCDIWAADINGDGWINAFDINPFVQLLAGGGQ